MSRSIPILGLLAAALFAQPVEAQDFTKDEQALAKKAVRQLTRFARTAKSRKVGPRAKQAFDLVLEYDADHKATRRELDFKRVGDEWVLEPPEKRTSWKDKATYENRFKVADEWYKVCIELSELHKTLGLKMQKAGAGGATFHLEKAVYFNAMDEEANLALGYEQGPGFFGTPEQIAFAKKMKEIEVRAVEIARKEYPVEALPMEDLPQQLANLQMAVPEFMKKPNIDIFGAKSKNFVIWTRGTQDNANDYVQWAERGLEFVVYLLGEKRAKQMRVVDRVAKNYKWRAFLFTRREREEFLKANPETWEGAKSVDEAMRFSNTVFRVPGGRALLEVGSAPRTVHDSLIAYAAHDGFAQDRNVGLGQGFVHAVCWYLKATSISKWGALPEGTVGDDALPLPQGTAWWMRTIRDQASSNTDWPLAQVPRERLSRFRNNCRMKTWSFTTWVLAAYPDKWQELFLKMPKGEKRPPTLEEVDAVFVKVLGKKAAVVDAEWREWARGDSGVAFGTGYGPPLLPARPSKLELAALERINEVRAQPMAYSWPKGEDMRKGSLSGLPPCEMDAEASMGCEAHALYVTNHQELHENPGPEIHEENPAHDDFSRKGQLAGSGNIISGYGQRSESFAADSIDGWMGVPYHRFPMLQHNIKRLGYSYVYENDLSVAVVDMHSLEEPYDQATAPRFLIWPFPGQTKVPYGFPNPESPNPLADQPEEDQDVTKCGYPISLQVQRELAGNLVDASIEVYESRKGGRPPTQHFLSPQENGAILKEWKDRTKGDPIPLWVHTPRVPLNKKQDRRDVVFGLPKEPLKKGKAYQVHVMLHFGGNDPLIFVWEFVTGSHPGLMKF